MDADDGHSDLLWLGINLKIAALRLINPTSFKNLKPHFLTAPLEHAQQSVNLELIQSECLKSLRAKLF